MLAAQSFATRSVAGMKRHFLNQLGYLLTLTVKVRLSNIVMHLLSVFFFLLIKGTKTGDSDAADIVECLTDGDYVTLKLRARTGNGDERKAWQKNKMKTHMKVLPPKIRKPCPYSTAQ